MARPDAVIVPEKLKGRGATMYHRVNNMCNLTDEILQVDKGKGEQSWIRKQPGGECFVTREPKDTIYFPYGHDHQTKPRYRWEPHPSLEGVMLGTLFTEEELNGGNA